MLKRQEGFTLTMALACVAILSISLLGMYSAIIQVNRSIVDSRNITRATNIAREILEILLDDPTRRDFYPSEMAALPNMRWQMEFLDSDGMAVPDEEVENFDSLTIRVIVYWQESQETQERSVDLSTRFTQGLK